MAYFSGKFWPCQDEFGPSFARLGFRLRPTFAKASEGRQGFDGQDGGHGLPRPDYVVSVS
jgi:hypothetical protein